jgi:hypothetical protein
MVASVSGTVISLPLVGGERACACVVSWPAVNLAQRALNLRVCCLLTTLSFGVGCVPGGAPVSPSSFDDLPGLQGRVIDAVTRTFVSDAAVSVQGQTKSTNAAGQYHLVALAKGSFPVVITHPGYVELRQTVTITGKFSTITGNSSDPADFELQPQP